ncbi:1D-myo-inositol 2-acetamido-2-deoxy-alpha-D-glucopyranoside deacetylase [Sphaerisporangium krabiense]|uniref:1D-myo-inositol 2-acetamido-2-deoxy-alpha-D-glucopyranoside deacetylase n=1 Tax=Sphaerisporangium krabiense TaxID=763782 RepID=A0A7W8Z7L7_9ACTN|nr:N-acetyl-1-D-myo-inositol-2-amino-2-deoxy-alpha-D-glucopyranoside deacetylase [Sphaerisporangium krabiense]MBB5628953.1 N-acetyl-1-D-myo-inositol-2-amino-2-deoxy-alpha-D-glucopyranoside deacetylase [Sphaerisporangium krabiense]GII60206.1 1D-myo-inositol 2-acetamido-2-deoxy-alpha-D-glucopyranoside deacetylase [Sphaerisporangium krabiense]
MPPERRILFVHAHPDDETIGTGATMARYAAEGAHVCLVTCTLGEEGEVIPPELRHLAADREDRLGEYRAGELARACAALGVADHRFLGGAGRWRDSGMMGAPTNEDPDCFWQADVDLAAAELAGIVREVCPQVIVTYDDNGYYGHPDHIQAHRVAWRAFEKAGDPSFGEGEPWTPSRFYATAMPLSLLEGAVDSGPFARVKSVEDFGFGVPDEQITTRVEAGGHLDAKLAALRAHRTQIMVNGGHFALSNNVGHPVYPAEYYTRLAGDPGPLDAEGRETGLFG